MPMEKLSYSNINGLASHYANILIELRDTYSDEFPAEMIHSFSKNTRYKVRGGWWTRLHVVKRVLSTQIQQTSPILIKFAEFF